MHKGTVDVGVRFTFYVDRISGLPPSSSPSMFSLGWAISKGLGRHRTGNTRHVVAAADGSVNFDGEALEVDATMHQLSKEPNSKFESRPMKVTLQEEAAKKGVVTRKGKTTGKLVVELADLAGLTQSVEERTWSFGGKTGGPVLHMRVRAQWLKYGGKLVSAQGAVKADGTAREPVQVGGQSVYLMTDQELSDDPDDENDGVNPFESTPVSSSGALFRKTDELTPASNALFRKTDGTMDTPNTAVSSSVALMEEARKPDATGALFKMTSGAEKKPEESTTQQLLEDARRLQGKAKAQEQVSSNPFGAPPVTPKADAVAKPTAATASTSAAATASTSAAALPVASQARAKAAEETTPVSSRPKKPAASSVEEAAPSPGQVLSPSSQELQTLRAQNEALKKLLESQDAKIEQLRVKVRSTSSSSSVQKSPESPTDSVKSGAKAAVLDEMNSRLSESEKALKSSHAQVSAQKQQLMSMEAALVTERKKCAELEASVAVEKKRNQEMFARLAELNAAASSKVVAAKDAPVVQQQQPSAEAAALEKQVAQLSTQLSAVNRELSDKQLAMMGLQKRLRELENQQEEARANASKDANPLQGEINSLRMQIVAMEQDYESQLDELRTQLEEAGAKQNGSDSDSLMRSAVVMSDDSSGRSRSRSGTSMTPEPARTVPAEAVEKLKADHQATVLQLEARVRDLEERLHKQAAKQSRELENARAAASAAPSPLAPGRNPLMAAVPPPSPSPSPAAVPLADLVVLRAVEEAVYTAPVQFDDENVAAAARLVMRVVSDDPKAAHASKMHRALVTAISRMADNQSLDGKCYWLQTVSQVLDVLSSTASFGVKSPRVFGIDVANTSAVGGGGGDFGEFPSGMRDLSVALYTKVLGEVRAMVVGEALCRAVFDSGRAAQKTLGARHQAGAVDQIAARLDVALNGALKGRLFPAVMRQLFVQIFFDMGALLFNTLLKRHDVCSATRAIEMKLAVSHFDNWPSGEEWPSHVREALRSASVRGLAPMKEACNLFFLDKSDAAMIRETCPSLNGRQLKSLLGAFVPDELSPDPVAVAVLDDVVVAKTDVLKMDDKAMLPFVQ